MSDKSSLLFWYPKIQDLGIPQPRTEIMLLEDGFLEHFYAILDGEKEDWPDGFLDRATTIADKMGYPFFLRSDHTSGKHAWKDTCYVECRERLSWHIGAVVEATISAGIVGLPCNALVFREYIPLLSGFTAFRGELPISMERRYFIRDGEVECHHSYWVEESILSPSTEHWREILRILNLETDTEVTLLTEYSRKVAGVLPGYWSVDFACAQDGRWLLIDMAMGERSWHDKKCEYAIQR